MKMCDYQKWNISFNFSSPGSRLQYFPLIFWFSTMQMQTIIDVLVFILSIRVSSH